MKQTLKLSCVLLLLFAVPKVYSTPSRPSKSLKSFPHTAAEDVSSEPRLQFTLQVGESRFSIEPEKLIWVDWKGKKVPVTLRLSPYRHFHKAGIRFKYPHKFTFEAEQGLPTQWILSGNDFKIMLFRFQGLKAPPHLRKNIIRTMIKRYGVKNVTKHSTAIHLGGIKMEGSQLDIRLAGTRLRQYVVSFAWANIPFILMLQDNIDEKGAPSKEGKRMMQLLSSSWTFDKVD